LEGEARNDDRRMTRPSNASRRQLGIKSQFDVNDDGRKAHNELARLGDRGLRDIGLTPFDAQVILRRPIWRRCWQSVWSCPNKRCRNGSICMAECRLTKTQFASTQSDIAIE
jgi:uncharacterized protein YjiS (DUF1127 family)